jgi:hypothetical protein
MRNLFQSSAFTKQQLCLRKSRNALEGKFFAKTLEEKFSAYQRMEHDMWMLSMKFSKRVRRNPNNRLRNLRKFPKSQ